MSKTRDTGFLGNVIKVDTSGNVSFVSGSTTLATINTSGQLSGSSPVLSSSYALNADLLDGLDSTQFTLTSSFAAQTASFTAFTASINSFTASQLVLNGTYATTGSNTFAGIQTVNSNLIVTGSITAQTLVVQTITSSISSITGSTNFGSLSSDTHKFTGSLFVTGGLSVTSGSIGIGTINPVGMLDIQQSNITNMGISFMNTYGASGASGSTVDISSKLVGAGLTGQVGSMIRTGKEGDYSSGGARDAYMSFSTAQNDALNERMRITSGGNVGVGRDDPSYPLDVYGTAIRVSSNNTFSPSVYLNFNNTNVARFLADQNSVYIISQNAYPVEIQTNGSSKALFGSGANSDVSFFSYSGYKQFFSGGDQYNTYLNNAGSIMYLNYQGNGGIRAGTSQQVLYAGSDIRIKKDISLIDSTLDKVLALSPKIFKYKEGLDIPYYGFIAQDMEEIFPELVRTDSGTTMCNDEEIVNQKSIESYGLVWASILTKAIQEQQAQINELKAQING
jgi:hypothetical protein